MSGSKLDGAGTVKMATLETAFAHVQRVHGIVEQMAMALKRAQSTAPFGLQLRRVATPLVGLLKAQFGMISDQVTALILIATRGGNEQAKVRSLREGVASVRTALEIAVTKVKAQHAREEGGAEDAPGGAPEGGGAPPAA
jgi:hypothetical protein